MRNGPGLSLERFRAVLLFREKAVGSEREGRLRNFRCPLKPLGDSARCLGGDLRADVGDGGLALVDGHGLDLESATVEGGLLAEGLFAAVGQAGADAFALEDELANF